MKTLFRRVLPLLQVQLGVRFRKGAFAKPDIVTKASFTDSFFCHITRKNFLKKSDFRCCTFSVFGSIYMKTLFRQVLPLLQVQLGVRFRKGAFAKPDIVAKASFTDLHFLVMTRNFFVLNTYAFSFRVRLNQYIIFGENSSEIHLCHVFI